MTRRLKSKKPNSEIPTASTADIAFLLIVFFMVTSVIAATKGIEFRLPKDDDRQDAQVETIEALHIIIPASGGYIVDKELMSIPELKNYVRDKLEMTSYNQFIIVQVDDAVPYGKLVEMLDILQTLKARNIAIPTKAEIAEWGMI